jgi:hypothetical protein
MGDQQGGGACLAQDLAHVGAQLRAEGGVEGAERLVEEDERRIGRQCAGQRDALLLPAG